MSELLGSLPSKLFRIAGITPFLIKVGTLAGESLQTVPTKIIYLVIKSSTR